MYVGIQLEAPDGFGSFQKGVRYYYAGNRPDGSVLIVWFARRKKAWRTYIMTPPRGEFEAGLLGDSPRLRRLAVQHTLPPWLESVEGINFEELEERRYKEKKQTYKQQVEGRVLKITPALERSIEILAADNPLREIAKTAAIGDGAKHPHRLQTWFFAYLLHGQDPWSLKQPTIGCAGTWKRDDPKHRDTKFGRPSLVGTHFGWSSAAMSKQIIKAFLSRCGEGVTMATIHSDSLIEEFGCKIRKVDGRHQIYHPDNKPFPSYGQFRYVVVRELGLDEVQRKLYGAARVRLKAVADEGNYTQQYANFLEGFEVDAYYTERTTAMYSEDAGEPLAVARGICVASGEVVGVGFALGSESGEAYRSMLFCMVAPKNYIARLYGIPVEHLDWDISGLPSNFISDRGPAGHRGLADRLQAGFPIKSIAPSYGAQSKASIESSHPRDVKLEGAPTFVQSELNAVEMAKREIYRAAADNHSSNITSRLSDEAIRHFRKHGLAATPHNLCHFLIDRLRTSARDMSIEDAVRAFWTPIKLTIDRNGVKHRHRHYTSTQFKATGIQRKLSAKDEVTVNCYVLGLVVRYVWVEVDGKLIEVEATKRVRIDGEDLNIPLSDLEETAAERAKLESATRLSAQAAIAKAKTDFRSTTGKGWNDGERKAGKPKRVSGTARHESQVIKGKTKHKEAA